MRINSHTFGALPLWRAVALAAASGWLLVNIFPTAGHAWMAWVALVPFFFALAGRTPVGALWLGWLTGVCYFFGTISWVTNTMVTYGHLSFWASALLLVLLAIYLGSYVALFGFVLKLVCGENPCLIWGVSPFLWTALELLRTRMIDLGFPWASLGHSQYLALPIAQVASLTGTYGISFLIVLVNATVFCVLQRWLLHRRAAFGVEEGRPLPAQIVFVPLALLSAVLAYGYWQIASYDSSYANASRLRVALLQGNVALDVKWNEAYRERVFKLYDELTRRVSEGRPAIVVWPETAAPWYFQLDDNYRERMLDLARDQKVYLLFGSLGYHERGSGLEYNNSAFFISPHDEVLGRYDKVHLVPFGEYIPFRKMFFFVDQVVEGTGDMSPGRELPVMGMPGGRFGVLICFEIIFPGLARSYVNRGAQFLATITNDSWFGRSAAPYQHFAIAVFRAIENRVPVVRAANTGISGIIDPVGRIETSSRIFEMSSILGDIVPKTGPNTWYTAYGDAFAYGCSVVVAVLVLWRIRRGEVPGFPRQTRG